MAPHVTENPALGRGPSGAGGEAAEVSVNRAVGVPMLDKGAQGDEIRHTDGE